MCKMTVKELKELLKKYEDSDIVEVYGGENGEGAYGVMTIDDDTVLEYYD